MSVFTCACGRKTTEPFFIKNVRYCVFCAEQVQPELVDAREKANRRRFQRREYDGHAHDFGKHSSR